MKDEGFQVLPFEAPADVYVINTCSVTDNADKKCRKVVKQARKRNEKAKVVIVGCYAQLKPKEISEIPGVDLVLGAAEKFNMVEHIAKLPTSTLEEASCTNVAGTYVVSEIDSVNSFITGYSIADRTRTFLKVQDGCDYSCTFCTIPLARGKSRSDTIANVVANAKEIGNAGVNEIVLTGVNTGDFGKGLEGEHKRKPETFFDLIQALDTLEEVNRFRISSIEPNLLTDEIIEFVGHSKRFMPHFHIPLQSGSDDMLKKMKRRYLSELYTSRVAKIKSEMPHACIGVDVIVGFPGETEAHFMETYNFLLELDISYLHVFTYSERPNTPAILMDGVVPQSIRQERNKMLRILSDKKKRAFYRQFEGQSSRILFESKAENGMLTGFSENYIKAKVPFSNTLINTIKEVELKKVDADGLMQAQ